MAVNYCLVSYKEQEGIEITGTESGNSCLYIPDQIDGLPVLAVAAHAFSKKTDLEEIYLPPTIKKIGAFAFYDCQSLKKISLYDEIEDYYDGAIRRCKNIREIDLTLLSGNYRIMKEMLQDNDRKLRFCLHEGEKSWNLTFPSYYNEDREDTRARVIHSRIVGAGYSYRECVSRTGIGYRQYDQLFYKAVIESKTTAAQIALDRLSSQRQLQEEEIRRYQDYLREEAGEIIRWLLQENNRKALAYMLTLDGISQEALSDNIDYASEHQQTELCSMLMETYHRDFGGKTQMETFSLEDF